MAAWSRSRTRWFSTRPTRLDWALVVAACGGCDALARRRERRLERERERRRPVRAQVLESLFRFAHRRAMPGRHPPQDDVRLAHRLEPGAALLHHARVRAPVHEVRE